MLFKIVGSRLYLVHITDLDLVLKKHFDQSLLYKGKKTLHRSNLNNSVYRDNTDFSSGEIVNASVLPGECEPSQIVYETLDSSSSSLLPGPGPARAAVRCN